MSETSLYQLIYTSKACEGFGANEMRALLPEARRNNAELGITGILLCDRGEFLQVLEGPEASVKSVFERIQRNQDHGQISVRREGPIDKRRFPEFTMGFSEVSVEDLDDPQMNDFYTDGTCYSELKPGWEKVFLTSFMQGHWPDKVA